jgi:hypothetical protein
MKFNQLILVFMLVIPIISWGADFDVGISIEPAGNLRKPKRRSMSNQQRNHLKTKVAQRYDLPEKWLNLMNQHQLYYLEMEELNR